MANQLDDGSSIPEIIDEMREATDMFFEFALKFTQDLKVRL